MNSIEVCFSIVRIKIEFPELSIQFTSTTLRLICLLVRRLPIVSYLLSSRGLWSIVRGLSLPIAGYLSLYPSPPSNHQRLQSRHSA